MLMSLEGQAKYIVTVVDTPNGYHNYTERQQKEFLIG